MTFDPISGRENTALSAVSVAVKRRLNAFLVSDAVNGFSNLRIKGLWRVEPLITRLLDVVLPKGIHDHFESRLASEIIDLVGDYYTESNLRTSVLLNMDLQKFGYQV